MIDLEPGQMFVGERVDPATHSRTGEPVVLDRADLTTHGLLVGMTGSGKTGLGIVLVEEALLSGVPVLVIDPKGDLANLALTFPDLSMESFAPWVTEGDPAATAATWREGLASWGIDGTRITALKAAADVVVYTPGSTSGVPVDVVGSLRAPAGKDVEAVADEIEALASGLLALAGVESDPLSGPEHVLLSSLVQHAWAAGRDLDLPTLVAEVMRPPIRKLGVFELDQFFPPDDRTALARRLNGLLASPSFAPWTTGVPLDVDGLLRTPDGRPRCAIVSIAHLSDEERQFAVALVLGKLVSWMRRQPGTSDLRVLVYFDEVSGFVPPVAAPPAKKPILTLMKQARAFGVGTVLATQNPVDVDYRGIGNAGTWMIGRLQTERDVGRLLDGLGAASGDVDVRAVGTTIGGLAKREFVVRQPGAAEPVVMTSRWAMSYLTGPLTGAQLATLTADHPERQRATTGPATAATATATATAATDTGEPAGALAHAPASTAAMPPVADGVAVRWLDPAAPWAATIGAQPQSTSFAPALAARAQLVYDDDRAGLRHTEEWEAVLFPVPEDGDPSAALAVDWDDRDLRPDPPPGATYADGAAPIGDAALYKDVKRKLVEHLARSRTTQVLRNPDLKLWSRPGEPPDAFRQRCEAAAAERADAEAAKLRDRYAARLDRARDAAAGAADRAEEAEATAKGQRNEEIVAGVGSILGDFLSGRRGMGSLSRRAGGVASRRRRTAGASRRVETARRRAEEKAGDIAELEEELADELAEIADRWAGVAANVEPVDIPLERTDVAVDDLVLVWVPVAGRNGDPAGAGAPAP